MRDDTSRNRPGRPSRSARKPRNAGRKTLGGTSPQHTAQEREKMQTGLRILARIIARAHLRRQESGDASASPQDTEAGD